jgi:hypothetical protein
MPNVVILSFITQSVVLPSVITLSGVRLSVVAPKLLFARVKSELIGSLTSARA